MAPLVSWLAVELKRFQVPIVPEPLIEIVAGLEPELLAQSAKKIELAVPLVIEAVRGLVVPDVVVAAARRW